MTLMSKSQQQADLEILKAHAEALWERQQEVFAAAGKVANEARLQGMTAARSAYDRVLPIASSTIATAAAIGDQGVRQILARLQRARRATAPVVVAAPAARGLGVGGWIGITIGVIAAGAVAYAVWQTLRADDDLWIEDVEDAGGAEDVERVADVEGEQNAIDSAE